MAVLSTGPLVSSGFLLVPPLIARLLARNMREFLWMASGIGGLSALAGFYVAYRWDLPVGPTDVALLGVAYGRVFSAERAFALVRRQPGERLLPNRDQSQSAIRGSCAPGDPSLGSGSAGHPLLNGRRRDSES